MKRSRLLVDVLRAKERVVRAVKANGRAEDAGRPRPHSAEELDRRRQAVEVSARRARAAGVDLTGIVSPEVGRID